MAYKLATYHRANAWLPEERIRFTSGQDANETALDAAALIRSRLYGEYTESTVDAWNIDDSSNTPPEIIQRIAAQLMAAQRYRVLYSEADPDGNNYGRKLEADAFRLLEMIEQDRFRIPGLVSNNHITKNDYYPNKSTGTTY